MSELEGLKKIIMNLEKEKVLYKKISDEKELQILELKTKSLKNPNEDIYSSNTNENNLQYRD